MLAWFTSWLYWRSNPVKGPILGPARNAPEKDDGKVIKAILAESIRASAETKDPVKKATSRPASPQVVIVSAGDLNFIRNGFRRVQQNAPSPGSQDPPLLKEMNTALSQGHKEYFQQIRRSREEKVAGHRKRLDEEMQALLLEMAPKQSNAIVPVIPGPLLYLEDIVIPKVEITVIEHILTETVTLQDEIAREAQKFETI